METNVRITFRNLAPCDSIKEAIQNWTAKLSTVYDRINDCHTIVESPHRHHQKGNLYHVRVELHVPGDEIIVGRDPAEHSQHEDVYVAIRDAFQAARRQLRAFSRKRHGQAKRHGGLAKTKRSLQTRRTEPLPRPEESLWMESDYASEHSGYRASNLY